MGIKVTKTLGGIRVDPDTYVARIEGVEAAKPNPKHPEWKPQFIWKFRLSKPTLNGSGFDKPVIMNRYTTQEWTTHEKNLLNKLLIALGFNKELGAELDLEEDCVNKVLRIIVEDQAKDDAVISKITGFMPPKPKSAVAKPAPKKETTVTKVDEAPPETAKDVAADDDAFGDFDDAADGGDVDFAFD